ncbi:hypothetical protein OIV83_000973 [Microbotryomycetes sp. JL201]|nr:hypothetical protein OIV83_000973 [Microbotryomycetes sp. JL201]
MASVCATSALDDEIVTSFVTSTSTRLVTSTLPSSTITSANPVVTRLCEDLAPILNGTALDPICSLVTSLVPVVTVIPGGSAVATELETVVATSLATSAGGLCRRDPEHFDDDVWAPNNHSPGDSGLGPLADDDSLLNVAAAMSEKGDGPSGLTRSATNATSPTSNLSHARSVHGSVHHDRQGGVYGPAGGYEVASDGQPVGSLVRQQSRHLSMRTSSSLGHDTHYAVSHDHRLAYEAATMQYPLHAAFPVSHPRTSSRRPMSHYAQSPSSELAFTSRHDRSRSEGGLEQLGGGTQFVDLYSSTANDVPQRMSSVASSRTLPQKFAPLKARPHLAVLTNGSPTSSTDSSGKLTSSSVSTAQTSMPPTTPLSPLEKELVRSTSLSDMLAPPKRPQLERNHSTDSFIVPSQFLGARIANADPSEQLFMSRTDSRASDAGDAQT